MEGQGLGLSRWRVSGLGLRVKGVEGSGFRLE